MQVKRSALVHGQGWNALGRALLVGVVGWVMFALLGVAVLLFLMLLATST